MVYILHMLRVRAGWANLSGVCVCVCVCVYCVCVCVCVYYIFRKAGRALSGASIYRYVVYTWCVYIDTICTRHMYIHMYVCTYVEIHVYIGRLGEPSRVCIYSRYSIYTIYSINSIYTLSMSSTRRTRAVDLLLLHFTTADLLLLHFTTADLLILHFTTAILLLHFYHS